MYSLFNILPPLFTLGVKLILVSHRNQNKQKKLFIILNFPKVYLKKRHMSHCFGVSVLIHHIQQRKCLQIFYCFGKISNWEMVLWLEKYFRNVSADLVLTYCSSIILIQCGER